jgi:cell wall-associated NlpC family hydrolase
MQAVTAPGAEEVMGAGAETVGAPGAQAVGAAGVVPEMPAPQPNIPDQAKPKPTADEKVPDYWQGLVNQPGGPTLKGAQGRAAGIAAGKKFIGMPYSWGGGGANGPSRGISQGANTYGFDCSGLVQYVLATAGINAPRWSYHQLAMGPRVALSQLRPGDLVGFRDGSHVAIYLGNGEILEAPSTGKNIRQRYLGPNEDAWGVSLDKYYN